MSRSTDHTAGEPIGSTIVDSVAAATDQEPTELHPLYDVIDPEALETLVESVSTPSASVRFFYHGFKVTVSADRTVTLTPNHTGNEPNTASDATN